MSFSHHGNHPDPEQDKALKRLMDQFENRAKREYSKGRISPDDDGDIAFAIAADKDHGRVIIDFGKAVTWIGLTPQDVSKLVSMLVEKAREVATEPFTVNI